MENETILKIVIIIGLIALIILSHAYFNSLKKKSNFAVDTNTKNDLYISNNITMKNKSNQHDSDSCSLSKNGKSSCGKDARCLHPIMKHGP